MDFFWDLSRNLLIDSIGSSAIVRGKEMKRGDALTIRLRFFRDDAPVTLAGDWQIIMALKETYAGDPLALADVWTLDDGVYSTALNTNTDELLAALAGADLLATLGEITFTQDGGDSWTSTQTLAVTVRNDVVKNVEGTPSTLPTPDDYIAARAVLYDRAQVLTEEQRNRAWSNLDLGALNSFVVVDVANFGERIGLAVGTAHNAFVRQLDTSEVFVLPPGGDPANAGDWRKIGEDFSYQIANRPDSGFRLLINSLNGFEIGVWNNTLGAYRVARLTGSGAAEKWTFSDLP